MRRSPFGLLRSAEHAQSHKDCECEARPSEEALALPSASCSPKISVKLPRRNFSGFAQRLRNPTYFVSYRGSEAKHVVFCLRQKYNMLRYTPHPKGQKAEQRLFWQAEACREERGGTRCTPLEARNLGSRAERSSPLG
jgi:hypothetical protein